MNICIVCESELTDLNWSKWSAAKRHYICKCCLAGRYKNSDKYKAKRKTTTKKKLFDKTLSLKITNFRMSAKKRRKQLEFTYAEIGYLMQLPCEYCGDNSKYNGIDRVDSSKGYTKDNSVPCCEKCNYGKNVYSVKEYIEHCKRVVNFKVGI